MKKGIRGEGKEGAKEYLAGSLAAQGGRAPLTAPGPPGAPGRRLGGGAAVRDVSAPRSLPARRPRVQRPALVQSASPGAPPLRLPLSLGGWSPLASGPLPGQPGRGAVIAQRRSTYLGGLCKARGRRPGAAALTPQRPGMQAGARGASGVPAADAAPVWREPPPDCATGLVMGLAMGETCVPSPALAPAQLLGPGASAVLLVRLEIMPVRQGQAHVRYM